jgi:hypothetical protein
MFNKVGSRNGTSASAGLSAARNKAEIAANSAMFAIGCLDRIISLTQILDAQKHLSACG